LVSAFAVVRVTVEALPGLGVDHLGHGVHIAAGAAEFDDGAGKNRLLGEGDRAGERLPSTAGPARQAVELVL
jgi:hypothetical protein